MSGVFAPDPLSSSVCVARSLRGRLCTGEAWQSLWRRLIGQRQVPAGFCVGRWEPRTLGGGTISEWGALPGKSLLWLLRCCCGACECCPVLSRCLRLPWLASPARVAHARTERDRTIESVHEGRTFRVGMVFAVLWGPAPCPLCVIMYIYVCRCCHGVQVSFSFSGVNVLSSCCCFVFHFTKQAFAYKHRK